MAMFDIYVYVKFLGCNDFEHHEIRICLYIGRVKRCETLDLAEL